jgi:RNA polymerase sigma factor (sigma-70 family)
VVSLSDAELVAAIEQCYRSGYPRFLRLAIAVLADRDEGRDAVQESFARALRSGRQLRRIESLNGWLWRTLLNVCLAEKRDRAERLAAGHEPAANGQPVEWPEVRTAVAALPERQRLVLFLRHYADLDYRQIAEVVGIERGTVAATLHAARRKVKEAIEEVEQ